ncbi:translocation/assembly module TamB domain-containing protein [Deinococcus arenicola]|uniref:Translocation/assembly module TamB domain-containing protein n=1 Tax=Deinococcus arenicola TaxID=2994950 RepID=A0ABU4DRX1_9DEIO|nr:translocation/assembly module TamB domain-containing protein [Deinococcus sp. ZS9-10]MDV6375183.1 translocation/assembly module TamB domain-containing protein [Deinococcus sp. ZS9-10]
MTDDPSIRNVRGGPDQKKSARPPARRRRWPWVVLGLVAVLALVVIFSPTLFGGWLLARFGPELGVSAQKVTGPIWSPRLEGVTVKQSGVSAKIDAAGVNVETFNPFTRTLRLGASVGDATLDLDTAELIKSIENAGGSGPGSGGGWNVSLGKLDVQNTRLNVNGKKGEIPDGQFQIKPRPDGGLIVTGRTPEGELSAEVALGENNVVTADLDADARVLNFYWPGVTAGRISGRFVFGDELRGDLTITDAALRVPEAKFVTVTGIGGTATLRGDNVDLKLAGQGWNGPITATGKVDLKAQNWTVTADAAPTVSGLARALGTTGEGELKLRVTAGGWERVKVQARATGAGKLTGIAFSNAQASYTFLHEGGDREPLNNDLTFSANTRLGESPQKLSGNWTFNRSGEAELAGAFGNKPLDVQASIDAQNLVTLRGQGLGGPLSGTFDLKDTQLNALLNPEYGAAGARVALSGTPDDLRAVITGGTAGPFALAGTARLDKQGLKADLGTVELNLDKEFRGRWSAQNLQGAGLTLSGSGKLDLTGGDVTGNLTAQVPGVVNPLSGPVDLNYLRQRGTFTAGEQVLEWNGDTFPITARNLEVIGGLQVSGDVTVTNTLKAFGTLAARGNGISLSATGRGTRASLRGTVNGVTVLADSDLSAPYNTVARIQGTDIGGNLSLTAENAVRFDLTTAGQTARGVVNGQDVTATGRVNLAALRPLVNLPDLSGTLDLNLAGQGGSAAVNASVAGANVAGTLTRQGGAITADLNAKYAEATARLNGQVYPQVGVSGTLSAQEQTLNAAVNGSYDALKARITGNSSELSFSGVTLPAQAVDLTATLTPKLTASGTWGDLNVTYDGATGLARVTGRQPLTVLGKQGSVNGRATWGPNISGQGGNFRGAVDARGQLDGYTATLSGPWSDLNVLLTNREGLQARGTASLPEGSYDVNVRGPVAGGLFVEGNVTGRGSEPRGRLLVRDIGGGTATVDLRGLSDFDVQAQGLTLAGQKLVGDLNAKGGVLSGTVQAGPFTINAQNGRINVAGEIAGQTVNATGRLTLPATLDDLNLNVSGPYFTAKATGGMDDLRGTVNVKAQRFGTAPLTLSVPAQSFPLTASLTGTRATVGGLTYAGGTLSGSLLARYALSGTPGTVKLLGAGQTLAALPFGPLTGRVEVLPQIGGTVTTSLSPALPLLPDNLRAAVAAGKVTAQLTATGATLTTSGTRYLGQPLNVQARVNWKDTLTVSGALEHPWARLPFAYNGQDLSIRGATLDARALKPVLGDQLADLTGRASLDLGVPGLDFAQASGRARVNLRANGQRAAGSVTLAKGQLSADLNSTLAGLNVRVRGPLYPQANATLTLDKLSATLRGNAENTLTLQATGQYAGRAVDVTATATGLTKGAASVQLGGTVAGAALNLAVNQGAGEGLAAWKTAGSVSVPDLGTVLLSETAGNVTATVGGTLADLKLDTAGRFAGVKFTAPASYRDGVLRLQGAAATLPQGTVRASGPIFPELKLSARASVTDLLPGTYTAQITGVYSKPDVNVQGVLTGGAGSSETGGLQAAGTQLTARLLGQDWKVGLSGEKLAGTLRGQLGTNALGGLANADLRVNAAYIGGTPDAPINVRLNGNPGWNARTGWSGTLRAAGDIPGGPLDAVLDGEGALKVAASVGAGKTQARLTGTLPADLAFKPGGTLNLLAFDVGALWGRPEQLRVSGTVNVDGPSWNAPAAAFAGTLADSGNELGGDLTASYRAGDIKVRLNGAKVTGDGTLENGRYAVSLKADTLRMARLLPRQLDVDALTFAGRVEASGTLADGPQTVSLQNVALKGQQEQAGPFSVYGTASYRRQGGRADELRTALSGSLRGGVLKAEGQLPGGVRVTVRDLGTGFLNAPALANGKVGADVTLRGAVNNPTLEGSVTARTELFDALATLSGRVRDPRTVARVKLLGAAGGTLYADAQNLNLTAGTVRTNLYGTVQSGGNTAKVNLSGVWPQLAGTVQATLAGLKKNITLSGDGRGTYALDGGELGSGTLNLSGGKGFIPNLTGTLNLTPLAVVGGTGQLNLAATLAGNLSAPTLAATVTSRNATAYGVTLADTTGRLGGTFNTLTGTLSQAGATVATLDGSKVQLRGLQLDAAGSSIRASGTAGPGGTADLDLSASGTLDGTLKANYRARALSLTGSLTGPQKLAAAVDVQADPFTGWHGGVRVTGGPSLLSSGDVLTAPAVLSVSGPLAYPLAQGTLGLLGAGARIVASQTGVQVRLVDGPGATASGAVGVSPDAAGNWRWNGATSLTRPELSLSLTPTGELADPSVLLSVRRGEWRASGTATLEGADLLISDGEKDGSLSFRSSQLQTNLPGLQLARLGIPSLNGVLTASGALNTDTQNGQVAIKITGFTSPAEVPYLGLELSGEASANVTLRGGRPTVAAQVTLPAGTLQLSALQGEKTWTGRLSGSLQQEGGTLNVNVGLDSGGLTGRLGAQTYPVDVANQNLTVDGEVNLKGQTFAATLNARNEVGGVSVDASGGIADLLPDAPLSALALRPTGEGYNAQAVLDELEVSNLKIAPELSGRISGNANLRDGGGTFVLRSEGLLVGPKILPARLEGTLAGGNWRIRGFLGESDFTAGLSTAGEGSGEVFGQGSLRALPVGALVSALTSAAPGEGVVTGVARFRFPLADPLSGSASVVAERIRVSTTNPTTGGVGEAYSTETLTGSGSLEYAQGELRGLNVQLTGAGTWDVRGEYTRQKVDLSARFTNTTFTPVLRLIPGVADLNPSLRGSLTLSAAGSYDRPRGMLRVQNVSGSVAGLSLEIPNFTGDLPDSGAFTAGGTVLTGGALGANGNLNIKGQLTLGKLSDTRVSFGGLLAPQGVGALPGSTALLAQNGQTWTLEAGSRSTNATTGPGTLNVSGQLSPRIDLTLAARNYNLPISVIYARESALDADLRAVDDGTLIRVSGAADFLRLTLGRADATSAAIPKPGQTNGQALGGAADDTGRTTDNYVSPLPELYSTFPEPVADGETAPRRVRPFLERMVFEDIPIRAPGGIRVDESLARAEFSTAGLTLAGSGARPRITGSIRSERGLVYLRDNEFKLSDSSVTFAGENLLPAFDITAAGQVQALSTGQRVPVTLNLSGAFVTRADGLAALDLTTTLSCATEGNACRDPDTGLDYTEPELYALVATGVPNLSALPSNLGALGASAVQTALNVLILGELERTLAKAFGLDVFRLSPNLAGEGGAAGATLTLGSYLTRDFYLQYQVDLTGESLLDATYSTPDDRFTFRVSTPLTGLDLGSLRPSFSAGYNLNPRTNLSIGVQNTDRSTRLRFGVTYRIGGR